jgi:serine/threonine protein kinase
MPIEKINFKTHTEETRTKEMLHVENIEEHLCAISEQLFQESLKVGAGNFSVVYRDTEAGIVYKKMKLGQIAKNNVHEEARFLKELNGFSDEVIVPFPVVSFVADLKREKDSRPVRQSVLAMQEISGYSFDKMLPKNSDEEPEKPLPEGFDPDIFFPTLKNFITRMHTEKNIYHRDLYDRNIMIDQITGKPVVIDFGDSVEFNEDFAEAGDQDAYGRIIIEGVNGSKIQRQDEDLRNVEALELQVRNFLTRNSK